MTVTNEGGATGFSWVGGQDTARYPAVRREHLPTTKNHLAQNLNKGGVENLYTRIYNIGGFVPMWFAQNIYE